jgi:CHAT domain-containing protein/tetratricopeptide (TPR) repeat protein
MAESISESDLSLEALEALSERKFEDSEEAIAALKAGLAAEPSVTDPSSGKRGRMLRPKLLLHLSEAYENRHDGEPADNLERALAALLEALGVQELKDDDARLWAQIQHDLARIYFRRDRDDRADNLEKAIIACEAALEIRSGAAFPIDWARTQMNLALAYVDRIRGHTADNLERAIALYQEALRVCVHDLDPYVWAMLQDNLAYAYAKRIRGEHAENVERAIELHEAALSVFTREVFPRDWALAQNNLGISFSTRILGERANNIERAIAFHEAALSIFSREAFPSDWAMTQNDLAARYYERIRGEQADNIERAIALYEAALTVYTRETFPIDWAMTLNNLAAAYARRVRGERAENTERAIALYEAALTVYTHEAFPIDWAMMQNNLGAAYVDRERGERADNIERAIGLHEAALTAFTRRGFPTHWAGMQYNLALAFSKRIRGERADNIERAISLYESALEVRTRAAFPIDWADTVTSLAATYCDRISSSKLKNLERAVELFEAALEIYTRAVHPREHLKISRNLGVALLHLGRLSVAVASLNEARDTFLMLLGEGLEEAEARGLIETAGPLFGCAAYAAAEMGKNEEAFALACEGRARLLATALRLRRLDLPASESARAEELRTGIREQSRVLEQVSGLQRTDTLDRLAQLRAELSGLVGKSEARTGKSDPLAEAARVCANGAVIVVPIVTDVGGKLFIVAPALERGHDQPRLIVVNLPDLTSERMKALMRGEAGHQDEGWLSAFARDIAFAERKRRSVRAVENIGGQLWTSLVGPLEAALEKLGITADAPLVFLPSGSFGLLPLGLAEESSSGRRLIERREIVYAPSLTAIDPANAVSEGVEAAAPSLAAVINPAGDLIYAPIEGALVAADFADRIVLDQYNARPADVLGVLKGKNHWHFATHGVFDLEEARRSALAMKEGAKLTVGALLEAEDLGRPRLVVLSACETGLHDVERLPEEFVGFPGAFMTVGAKAVLATQWPVDDCATTLVTARFYDGYLNEGLAPAAALRQAQLWLASATRNELADYARQKGAQSGLATEAIRQLQAAVEGAGAELARFFDLAAAHRYNERPPDERVGEEPDRRPFAHPIYWGGFVLTGR